MGIRVTYNPQASEIAGPALAAGMEQSKKFYLQASQNQQKINLDSQRINLQQQEIDNRINQADLNRQANLNSQEQAFKNKLEFFDLTNDARIAETEARNEEAREFLEFRDEMNDVNKIESENSRMEERDRIRLENHFEEDFQYDRNQKRQIAKIKQSIADIDNKPWPQYIKDQAKQQLEFKQLEIKPKEKKILPSIDDQIKTEVKRNEDGSFWQRDSNGQLKFHKAPVKLKDEKQAIYARAMEDTYKSIYDSKIMESMRKEIFNGIDDEYPDVEGSLSLTITAKNQLTNQRLQDALSKSFKEAWNRRRNLLDNFEVMRDAEIQSPGMAEKIMDMGNPAPERQEIIRKKPPIQAPSPSVKKEIQKKQKKVSDYMSGITELIGG